MNVTGYLVDVHLREVYPASIKIEKNRISKIVRRDKAPDIFILPGFIDAHVHIESSMITPGVFAMEAIKHGTIGTVSDPHEIANILGLKGVDFMIKDGNKVPFRFYFGAPSCVPATIYETAGATLDKDLVGELLIRNEIKYLSEMMNFPGVINDDPVALSKINYAKRLGKPIDGHAPGLTGAQLQKYVKSGITTDHECSNLNEALEKISLGMKVLIREGSAARNLDSLKALFGMHPEMIMLCSDDIHPEMLMERHIDKVVSKLIKEGFNLFDVLRSATVNPVKHYNLEAGLLAVGQYADFIVVNNLTEMNVLETWIAGKKVYDRGMVLFNYSPGKAINIFNASSVNLKQIEVLRKAYKMRVIKAFDGELFTQELTFFPPENPVVGSDVKADVLKIVVKDRYKDSSPAVGFINGFGLKQGAFASSVSHDSHNIVCIGTNDDDIVKAINEVVRIKGGLSYSENKRLESLQLNIAGIMSDRPCKEVASAYQKLSDLVRSSGCQLKAPFMTLSFMALLVIPELKISDRGLFDGKKFCQVPLFD